MKSSIVVLAKNDNYGNNLTHRAKMSINSMVENFDEVIVVDWKTRNRNTLLSTIIDDVPHLGKIKSIEVSNKLLREKYPNLYQWNILEAIGRNIGIRRATGDWVASSNIDIVTTPLDISQLNISEFYTTSRKDIEENFHLGQMDYEVLKNHLWENQNNYPGKPQIDSPTDKWSLVVCCGDFQIGYRDIWHKIKGFEESVLYGCGIDTNIMKKASSYAQLKILPYNVFHLNHGKVGERFDGEVTPPMSNQHTIIQDFDQTTNGENWGLAEEELIIETI
jgi:hypothetical protein